MKGWFDKKPRTHQTLTERHVLMKVTPLFGGKYVRPTTGRLLELRTMPYHEYLQTPEWKKRRFSMLRWSRRRCEECGSKEKLQVHHKTYERRGQELASDLKVLCRDCHETHHLREVIAEAHEAEARLGVFYGS